MSRPTRFLAVASLLLLVAVLYLVAGGSPGAAGSTLSAGRDGWLAGRLYLERRGVDVVLRDRPLDAAALKDRALLLVAPFQRTFGVDELVELEAFLRQGGRVAYAYAGDETPGYGELQLQQALDLVRAEVLRPEPPLGPDAYFAYYAERTALVPADPALPAFEAAGFERAPSAPTGAEVLYRSAAGTALVYRYPWLRGQVLVLPAALLSNAELSANLAAAELLRAELGEAWAFHEFAHGMVAVEHARERARFSWNLFVLQLVLLYAAGVWVFGRPFGPRWREQVARHGSAGVFLKQLGQLHGRLGHHAEAARLLVERGRQLDDQLAAGLPPDAEAAVHDGKALVELARKLARTPPPLPKTSSSISYEGPSP